MRIFLLLKVKTGEINIGQEKMLEMCKCYPNSLNFKNVTNYGKLRPQSKSAFFPSYIRIVIKSIAYFLLKMY